MADEKEDAEKKEGPEAGDDAEKKGDSAETPKNGSKTGMMVVIIVGFLVMTLTPLISFFVVKAIVVPPIQEQSVPNEAKGGAQVILDIEAVRVNIAGTKATRFVMVKPHLVLSEARLKDQLTQMTPMLADRISNAIGRRTIDELEGTQARESLKRDIMSEINAVIQSKMAGAVVDVYFSEFLIQ